MFRARSAPLNKTFEPIPFGGGSIPRWRSMRTSTLFSVNSSGGAWFNNAVSTVYLYGNQVGPYFYGASFIIQSTDIATSDTGLKVSTGTYSGAGKNQIPVSINPIYNQSTTSSGIDLRINRTESSVGSGVQRFLSLGKGGASYVPWFEVDNVGNTLIGNVLPGTSSQKVFAIGTGVAPSTSPADAFQFYSADIVAGNAAPHFRTETGDIVKLYKYVDAAINDTPNSGDATTDGIIAALQALVQALGIGAAA